MLSIRYLACCPWIYFNITSMLPGTIIIADNVTRDAGYYQSRTTANGRLPASVDPISVALALRSVEFSIDAMQSQYFRDSFFEALG